mmetsp:Transcript_85747/g.239773  ORF Transcript_85747/g.239773 Transcript_85747/m.239773 type:complete len:350 (-) Transcript_85747:208-1257(-)
MGRPKADAPLRSLRQILHAHARGVSARRHAGGPRGQVALTILLAHLLLLAVAWQAVSLACGATWTVHRAWSLPALNTRLVPRIQRRAASNAAPSFEGKVAVTLGPYRSRAIKVTGVPQTDVSDATIDAALAKKQSQKTRFERINFTGSGARLGLTVLIDMEAKHPVGHPDQGMPIPGTKLKGYALELKEGQPEPWRQFVVAITERGMGQMEEKTFAVSFPEDYRKPAFAGKTVDFKVLVREIGEMQPVEPDTRPHDEQRLEIATELRRQAEKRSFDVIDKQLRETLLKTSQVDTDSKTKNVAWAKFGPESERAMKWNFILEEVARAEGIDFSNVMQFLRAEADIDYAQA